MRRVPLLVRLCDLAMPSSTLAESLARAEACEATPQGKVMPSLSAELLRVSRRQRIFYVTTAQQAGLGLESVRVANVRVPTTPQGEVWVHYTRPVANRYIPAWQVIEGRYHCALEMHAFASAYSADLKARGTAFGKTRIGVHTGEVIVGNFGGSTMFDYRARGDPVNTAARLEGANKYLGTTVCVSAATLSGVPEAVVRAVGRLVVKGKTHALMVYEPVVTTAGAPTARDADYDAAFELLQHGSPEALPAFELLARARTVNGLTVNELTQDTLVAMHLERLRNGAQDDQIKLDEK